MINKVESVFDIMPKEVKSWFENLASREDFSTLSRDMEKYIYDLNNRSHIIFVARLKNTHCMKCKKIGCVVELHHVGRVENDSKMLCRECFDSI